MLLGFDTILLGLNEPWLWVGVCLSRSRICAQHLANVLADARVRHDADCSVCRHVNGPDQQRAIRVHGSLSVPEDFC